MHFLIDFTYIFNSQKIFFRTNFILGFLINSDAPHTLITVVLAEIFSANTDDKMTCKKIKHFRILSHSLLTNLLVQLNQTSDFPSLDKKSKVPSDLVS